MGTPVGLNAGIVDRLQDPSMVSRLFYLSGLEETSQIYSFCTWGALILAFIATFSGVIVRTKFVIFSLRKRGSVSPESLLRPLVDDDEGDDCCSSSSSDDEDEGTSQFDNRRRVDEDLRVAGSGCRAEDIWQSCKLKLRRRRSVEDRFPWSDFTGGKNVVKLWDGLGLEFGFQDSSRGLVSTWDLNRDKTISSILGGRRQIPPASIASQGVMLSPELERSRTAGLRIWDARFGRHIPAVLAEWKPNKKKIVGIESGEVEKVYVMDDAGSLAIRDMRNANRPLEVSTESDGRDWRPWEDADAVIMPDGARLFL